MTNDNKQINGLSLARAEADGDQAARGHNNLNTLFGLVCICLGLLKQGSNSSSTRQKIDSTSIQTPNTRSLPLAIASYIAILSAKFSPQILSVESFV